MNAWTEDSVRLIATPSPFAKSALFYVQEAGHFITAGEYYTEREHLDSYLVVFTLSGQGQLTYLGDTYPLLPNQVFFINCMNYQHYCTLSAPWELLWVHLNGSSIRGYYEQFSSRGCPVLTLGLQSELPNFLREIVRVQQHKSVQTEIISSKLLVQLLTELLLASQEQEAPSASAPGYIPSMKQELELNYSKKLTLDHLAKLYKVSKYHLAKQFKQFTGFSPGEYLINTRITHAKELLKYSDMPVSEIAAQVGIDNVSHFINLFKDRTEHTPLIYRKKWQQP